MFDPDAVVDFRDLAIYAKFHTRQPSAVQRNKHLSVMSQAPLTIRDLKIFKAHIMDGKTLNETAAEVGCSRETVKRTKKNPAFRDLMLACFDELGKTPMEYAKKLWAMTEAKKEINVNGSLETVDDNQARMTSLKEIGQIYGVYAPQKVDISQTISDADDAELFNELSVAAKELELSTSGNGRPKQDNSALSPDQATAGSGAADAADGPQLD